ncbi:EmrB/QacA family drug resistance transporter [Novosphingobium sp. TH158]|nr:EmrB/QacA family drug resistance transporter [Novosphingobium sp. TH158]
MVTVSIMAAAIMNQVDTTIANVALPHMQGTTSASREQISWVLTSYIIAMAITTPLCGWLAERFGRRNVLLVSIAGFTLVSGLCGMSTNLEQLVGFRLLQGMFGASLIPIAQVILMTLNPPEERGRSMAIFGLGFIMGPLIGPLLGGWLTENYSWHWVFLINLPVGVLAFLGTWTYLPEKLDEDARPFDLFGFGLLALGIGAMQLVFDRGHAVDWFESTEIWIEASISALALFLFGVHCATTRHPFVRFEIFRDRNFAVSSALGLVVGVLMFGTMSLLPPMLAGLFGQPIMDVGVAMAPRGIGTFFATLIVGGLIGKTDVRLLALVGLGGSAISSLMLSTMSLQSDMTVVMVTGFLNGFAMSFLFVPLSTTSFATIPPEYMNEASAVSTLIRYIGSAAGISAVQVLTSHNEAVVQSRLTEGLRPDNPIICWARPGMDIGAVEGAGSATGEAVRQALMVAYIDTFWMLFLMCVIAMPLVLLLKKPPQHDMGGQSELRPLHAD